MVYSKVVNKTTGVISDDIGRLMGPKSGTEYPEKLRRIEYYDAESDLNLVFLTNNPGLNASEITFLYKKR